MLAHLRIRDLVLIDDLDLPLSSGFTVLTGETGAGKSLVATAIHLLLGRKAGADLVRRGALSAEVEGLFDISDEPAARERLLRAGLPADEELLVRRVLPADGRQRCYVNGRLASRALLADLARGLASFAGQREHLSLLDPARQLALVDAFGSLGERVAKMTALHAAAVGARNRLDALLAREQDRARRLDYLAYQLSELDRLDPKGDEIETLAAEAERLRHQDLLLGTARRTAEELYEADGSLYERLGALAEAVERAAIHDPELAEDSARLREAAELAGDAARRLAGYAGCRETDPDRLEEVEERRNDLIELTRKHGMELEDLVGHIPSIRAEVEELADYENVVDRAREEASRARETAVRHAGVLTRARARAAAKLSRAVSAELDDLALEGGSFSIALDPSGEEPGPTGADAVRFLVAFDPGEGTHPLSRVASGGQLSRLMLGLKRAVAGVGPVGTYVFDEVDAGIGGAVASAVGRKLREVSKHHQVVCVTHLAQIAGLADRHVLVKKARRNGRTITEVRRLDDEDRVKEVARMLGGDTLTEKARAAARELLAG